MIIRMKFRVLGFQSVPQPAISKFETSVVLLIETHYSYTPSYARAVRARRGDYV